MPPSPALRCSPGREFRAENSRTRGRSFESGFTLKTCKSKDDDLVLFNEVQNQERDSFLLHTADDFEDSLSKLRHFSDFKTGISILMTKENSDLLNVGCEKNDYDWLLTPPETPLFPSLVDDDTQPINLASRGRPRSKPIMIARSALRADKSYQSSRTSSSPHRLSPSSRYTGTLAQVKGRPSSSPRSNSPPIIRSTTPTRRSSTRSNKLSSSRPRSSTPTLRRTSTTSGIQSSNYGGRRASPVKASCGNSASLKLRGCQMTLPGFTSEAPPKLQTSLLDRPVSHTRGSSPASGNERQSSVKPGRKSSSPTNSRKKSPSHSQERNNFSSYSKASVVSCGDDDEEPLHSITMGTSPSTSVPKRSFDSALGLMDQLKTPHNMFRPLLSSVPATTFQPSFSRNSSPTSSGNTSSELGVISVAPVESSELEQNVRSTGWERTEDSDMNEEVFLFDKMDEMIEYTSHEVLSGNSPRCDENFCEIWTEKIDSEDLQNPKVSTSDAGSRTTIEPSHCQDNHCDIDGYVTVAVCKICGKEFDILDANADKNLCLECTEEDRIHTAGVLTCVLFQMETAMDSIEKKLLNSLVPEFLEEGNTKVMHGEQEGNIKTGGDCLHNICSIQLLDQRALQLSVQCLDGKKDSSINSTQPSYYAVNTSSKVNIPEGTSISVFLLQRSGSSMWPILHGKTLSETNILCLESSYSSENINALRRSLGQDGVSASSSVDPESSKQTEAYVQHQLSRKSEPDNTRNDADCNAQSMSSDNYVSIDFSESRHLKCESDEKISTCKECLGYDSLRKLVLVTVELNDCLDQSNLNDRPSSSSRPVVSEHFISEHAHDCRATSTSEVHTFDYHGNSDFLCSNDEDSHSSIHADADPQNNGSNVQNIEGATDANGCSVIEEDYFMVNHSFQDKVLDSATNSTSIVTFEPQDCCNELEELQNECMPSHNLSYPEHSIRQSISLSSENDISFSTPASISAVHEHGNCGESAIVFEGPREQMPRSLTLVEATDTILFCSSITHDLVYKAATIGMEKELEMPPESQAPHPTGMVMGKLIPHLRESGKVSNKQAPRSQKFKRKRTEAQTRPPKELEIDVNVQEFTSPDVEIPRKFDTSKPPKLEWKCNCTVM